MGWIDPVVNYALSPRLTDAEPRDLWTGALDHAGDSRWELVDTQVRAGLFDLDACEALEIENSTLDGVTFAAQSMPRFSVSRCALVGCDLSGARFDSLHDIDAFDLDAEDVAFTGSDLEKVNIDRLRARRVDLRGTRQLGLERVGPLAGCLIEDHQLAALSYQLAFAAGLDIERTE